MIFDSSARKLDRMLSGSIASSSLTRTWRVAHPLEFARAMRVELDSQRAPAATVRSAHLERLDA
jgi:hypothetical protein